MRREALRRQRPAPIAEGSRSGVAGRHAPGSRRVKAAPPFLSAAPRRAPVAVWPYSRKPAAAPRPPPPAGSEAGAALCREDRSTPYRREARKLEGFSPAALRAHRNPRAHSEKAQSGGRWRLLSDRKSVV